MRGGKVSHLEEVGWALLLIEDDDPDNAVDMRTGKTYRRIPDFSNDRVTMTGCWTGTGTDDSMGFYYPGEPSQ